MIVIHCGKPNFIAAEDRILHRGQVMRTEQQLCALLVQIRVLEHLNHIPKHRECAGHAFDPQCVEVMCGMLTEKT